jgi:hypothetical protein
VVTTDSRFTILLVVTIAHAAGNSAARPGGPGGPGPPGPLRPGPRPAGVSLRSLGPSELAILAALLVTLGPLNLRGTSETAGRWEDTNLVGGQLLANINALGR